MSNLTIAFDTWSLGDIFRNQGIYVYARNLLAQFRELAVQHSVEVRPFVCAAAGNDANAFPAAPGFKPTSARLLKFDRLWRYGGGWLSERLKRPDLIFAPSFNTMQFDTFVPAVVTIHDATPVVMPSHPENITRKLKFSLRWAARFSRTIITDSICSKNDLVRLYGLPESRVAVVYLGYDKAHYNNLPAAPDLQKALLRRLSIERPYLIHHGALQPRKNLKRLIQAYRLLLSRNRNLDLDLVLCGPLGWKSEEIVTEAEGKAGCPGKVHITGVLSDSDLALLIKGARLAIVPSLYEGFCLPMVEAMACGVPVIASSSSCLPEISGGVLKYFNPESIEEMSFCMQETLENEPSRRELSEKGLARASEFDWRRCAEQTLEVLVHSARNGRT